MEKGKAKSLVWVLLKLVLPAASCTCQVIHWEIIESAEPLLSETDTRVYKSFPPGKCLLFLLECVEFDVQWGYFRPESFCLRHLIYRLPPLPCQPGLFFTLYFGTELPEVTLWRQQSVRSLGIIQPLEDFAAQTNICGDHKVDILSPSSCTPPCSTSPIWLALSQRATHAITMPHARSPWQGQLITAGPPAMIKKRKMRWFDEWIDDVAKLFRTFDVIKFAFASKWGVASSGVGVGSSLGAWPFGVCGSQSCVTFKQLASSELRLLTWDTWPELKISSKTWTERGTLFCLSLI